jgi:hypothetical protein
MMIRTLLTSTLLTSTIAAITLPATAYAAKDPAKANNRPLYSPLEVVLIEMDRESTPETALILQAYQESPKALENSGQAICQLLNSQQVSPRTLVPMAADIFSEEFATFPGINARIVSRIMLAASVISYCPEWFNELSRY